jgi:glucose/arabinose dehydrogenase
MKAVLSAGAALMLLLFAVGDSLAQAPMPPSMGPDPQLPAPHKEFIPTVDIAPAQGWPEGAKPKPAPGLAVAAFATGFQHPRWLYVLPNGDVLVAETDTPQDSQEVTGVIGFVSEMVQKVVGARQGSANRIILLRDADGDGVPETRTVFLEGVKSPFGMALVGQSFYVAATDALLRFPYVEGETQIKAKGEVVAPLPGGPINHHWTKNVIASRDGKTLYVTVGSNSNVGENGLDKEERRAGILEIDPATGQSRVFASGLRNPNGLAWQPETGALWTVVNERDLLGPDLVPDFLTSVKEGGFYGWPFSYFGQHVDDRVKPQNPALVAKAIKPDYALGGHTAALGLAFGQGMLLPEPYRNGAFIGLHGSWNRKPRAGYKVVFVPFKNGQPSGPPLDVLTGFLSEDGKANGRPVGVAFDKTGALLVADDVGNAVWRITPAAGPQ